jgi:butyryl-CoA dehydrogenase
MSSYAAPLKDYRFLLDHVFLASRLCETERFAEASPDLLWAVIEEGARFAEQVLAPLNRFGDEQGCAYSEGRVTTPAGFPQAYQRFRDGGWAGLTAAVEHGGQGLPHTLYALVDEMMTSANPGFAMYRGLIDGAYRTIARYAAPELQDTYLPAIVAGETLPTMNLTEPHCGSDLGLLRTRAEPDGEGAYRITGVKIFITGGEHDLTEDILHLVLARLPGAPAGSRGISLFLVPKFLVDASAGTRVRNAVSCGGVEHKMGLKSSATCVMNYDGARGWLVGAPHGGLAAMFTMMNAARLGVALQGVCAAEAAGQIAAAYAASRRQGAAPGATDPAPHAIACHPDVRRMLRTQQALAQGGRALALRIALALDFSEAAPEAGEREANADLVQLLTPVAKSFLTDAGTEAANLAVQVLGGHGYIREWGVEQWVRDIRISAIYEGTNGIQALDLVGRKLALKDGRPAQRYFDALAERFERALGVLPSASRACESLQTLRDLTAAVSRAAPVPRSEAASDYLSLFGLVALAGEWAEMACVAAATAEADPAFCADKIATADFYMRRILPRHLGLAEAVRAALAA